MALKLLAAGAIAAVLSLSACVTAETKPIPKIQAKQATVHIPEAELLDVGIRVFDPGIPKNLEGDEEALAKKRIYPDLRKAEALMPGICEKIGAPEYAADGNLGKVSIVGVGIQTAPGYAARMFRAMSDAGINIELISTSEIRLTCIIDSAQVPDAVRALHAAFELETAE